MNRFALPPMVGHLVLPGEFRAAGFQFGVLPESGLEVGPSHPILNRRLDIPAPSAEARALIERMERGEQVGDLNQILAQLWAQNAELTRAVTSTMSAFPVRENLEAEAKLLIPIETPLRNRIPRVPGAGTASAWKQLLSLGGGWAANDQPGEGPGAIRAFYSETGAPAEHTSVYADKSAGYKLLGTFGSVTGFAMAAGANFQNQLATEKTNSIRNLMLNEENAIINGDATSTAAPWGDGTNALAFNGVLNLTTTANGTPAAQVQTGVGALTIAHIDAQLTRLWKQGAQGVYLVINAQESQSLINLSTASGTIIRQQTTGTNNGVNLGTYVTGIVHPMTGEIVPIIVSRFMPAGTIWYGSTALPDGTPTLDMSVLPQVQLPELAPDTQIQGYVAQELAPAVTAPQVYPWIVTSFEVLRLKSARHVAKSTGVTAV